MEADPVRLRLLMEVALGLWERRRWGRSVALWEEAAGPPFEHALARFNLGYCLYEGLGVEKNTKKAYTWFKRSALQVARLT